MVFKFRYEALLFYRQHIKEKAEIELSKSQQKLKSERDLKEKYEQSLDESKLELNINIREKISSDEMQNYSDYIIGLKVRISKQELEIQGCKKVVEEKMKDLLNKTKQYKVIERLKEKDFEKWKHQQLQIEQKRLNEVAVIRHGRVFP